MSLHSTYYLGILKLRERFSGLDFNGDKVVGILGLPIIRK